MQRMTLLVALAFVVTTTHQQSAQSQDAPAHSEATHSEHQSESGPNGGSLQSIGELQIETVILPKGIMFMVYDQTGKMLQVPDATGELKLRIGDSSKEYTYKLQAMKNHAVGVAVDLSKVAGRTLHLAAQLDGFGSQPLSFQSTGKLGMGLSDAMLISLQKTCPVTGQKLGSMGAPPKIMLGDKPLFVCCAGCSTKLQADSETYLKKFYSAVGAEVRPGVFESTLADAAAIAAQKSCPVMDEELGGMGTPQKVKVAGKAVYICCAGCAKKLVAEPKRYLDKLAKAGVTPPDFK